MPLPLEDHVRIVLLENERGAKFHKAVTEGWGAYKEQYPQRHRWLRKSSSRHLVWEEVAARLKAIAATDPGITPIEHQDTLSLVVEDEVLFRLKHANTALTSSNYPTREARLFDNHDIDLFNFKGLQRVRLCYVLDRFETDLIWIGIAAHSNGNFLWKIDLDGAGIVAAPIRLPFSEKEADTAKLAQLKKRGSRTPDEKKKDDGRP